MAAGFVNWRLESGISGQQPREPLACIGLLDFAEAMIGDREYDFAAVGIFITRGRPDLFRRFLKSYGYRPDCLDEALRTRLMLLTLLHRYCHLPWFMSLNPPGLRRQTLECLSEFWFSC